MPPGKLLPGIKTSICLLSGKFRNERTAPRLLALIPIGRDVILHWEERSATSPG